MKRKKKEGREAAYVVPAWEGAAESIIRKNYSLGTILSHQELLAMFGMTHPMQEGNGAYRSNLRGYTQDLERFQLTFMSNMEGLRKCLLTRHKLCLENIRGEGYRLVPPREQTSLGLHTLSKEVRRSLTKAKDTISNVNLDALDLDEQREHSDGLARFAFISSIIRRGLATKRMGFTERKKLED